MPQAINITFGKYSIIRIPPTQPVQETPRYIIYQPDGSVCCQGVTWPEVEVAIEHDADAARPMDG